MTEPASRCVVFDLDDTLYLERDYVRSGFESAGRWARAELGVDGFGERCWELFLAGVRGRTFDDALTACGVTPTAALVGQLVRVYRCHEPAIRLLPDAEACIAALRATGARLGVITDGPFSSQWAKARAVGAPRWADAVVCTDGLGPGFAKPNPRAFAMVEEACEVTAAQCTYVADNVSKDFAGPKARGWRTIRVRRPDGLHQHLDSGADVDVEVGDLGEVAALAGRMARAG